MDHLEDELRQLIVAALKLEDLDPASFGKLLDDLAAGRPVKIGSQIGRNGSEPVGGLTSLTSLYGADGKGPPANSNAAPAANIP